MVLNNHFAHPLSTHRHWHAFHNAWATYIAADLNRLLPDGYFAEPNVQFGIEIDVAAFEEATTDDNIVALPPHWIPPTPQHSLPFQPNSETVAINIFNDEAGPRLMAAIELVSPANKDHPAHRQTFVSKCAAYLQRGLGLLIVDVVTTRQANLHHDLLDYLDLQAAEKLDTHLYATAYRVALRDNTSCLDIWQQPLEVGQALPTLPLWLQGGICLPVDLQASYAMTCQAQRIYQRVG